MGSGKKRPGSTEPLLLSQVEKHLFFFGHWFIKVQCFKYHGTHTYHFQYSGPPLNSKSNIAIKKISAIVNIFFSLLQYSKYTNNVARKKMWEKSKSGLLFQLLPCTCYRCYTVVQ